MKVITSHKNADFDSLSSMVAAKKLYPDAVLVFPGSQERTVREFLIRSTLYILDIAKLREIDYPSVDTLILVDTRQKERIGDLARILDNPGVRVHVFDHHPESLDDIKGDSEIVRSTGATVTILASILRERNLEITPEEATVMMLGLYEETGSFMYPSTTTEDFDAASFLLSKGAKVNLVSDMLVKELTPEQVFLLNELMSNASVCNVNGIDIIVTEGSSEHYVGDLAVVVQKFRDMENVNAVFAIFRMEDRVYIIGRSRIPEVDAGYTLSLMGGGGHKEAASATVKGMTIIEAKEHLLMHLKQNVKPLRKARDIMFSPVKSVEAESPISEAQNTMVKYNINALPVLSNRRVVGIITRQIVEKAAFHKLENIPVRAYMSMDSQTVRPDDSIERVKEIIIGSNQRFLPVTEDATLVGAITRTDLLRVLEDEITKRMLGKLELHDMYQKRKNVKHLMEERLETATLDRLRKIGRLAGSLDYHVFLVGGLVRDLLLRIDNYDIDIVVEGDGIAFAAEMAKEFGVKVRPHKEFGTAKVVYEDGFKLDVATARLEYYKAPAALPIVEHSSLRLDLHRRDFTINTLAISLNTSSFGQLIDFFGGQRDLKESTIRVLHSLSFVEDPTRVFRAVRFEHRFGFQIGKHTMNLIRNAVEMGFLSRLRGKRIWGELVLILLEGHPERVLRRLQELDLLRFVYPTLTFEKDKETLFGQMDTVYNWYELLYTGSPCEKVPYYILGLVGHMGNDEVFDFCRKMEMAERLGKRTVENIGRINETLSKLIPAMQAMKKSEIFRLINSLSEEAKLFIMAKTRSPEIKKAVSYCITHMDAYRPLITGVDLKLMGVKEGPVYREILEKLKDAKMDMNLKTRDEEIRFVHSCLIQMGVDREEVLVPQ